MKITEQKDYILKNLIEELDIPDSAYDKAKNRYESIGNWLGREGSKLEKYDTHIFPQGSFRLGTVIKPINNDDDYDLDLACKLRQGITKRTHSQKKVKEMVGHELKEYIAANNIKEPMKSKHRCCRIEYQDGIKFHMDIVPAIPAIEEQQQHIYETIMKADAHITQAEKISTTTIYITDDRSESFEVIADDWEISNPEGYALWFEEQLKEFRTDILLEKAQVDEMPLYKRKSTLQRVIQLLKRHRDIMYSENEDSKPISIIITTLAARAYHGETDLQEALTNILTKMEQLIRPTEPRVPNPVNPEEDFADRWAMEKYTHLRLEDNFRLWIKQAQIDFNILGTSRKTEELVEMVKKKFNVQLSENVTNKMKEGDPILSKVSTIQVINPKEVPTPWLNNAR
jgi:hypothetical protein